MCFFQQTVWFAALWTLFGSNPLWSRGSSSNWSLKVNELHSRETAMKATTTKANSNFFLFLFPLSVRVHGRICREWENPLADSRLDFTEMSPQRTEVALESGQRNVCAIWSQPSDSDYEHTPNGWRSVMGPAQRITQPCLQYIFIFIKGESDVRLNLWENEYFAFLTWELLLTIWLENLFSALSFDLDLKYIFSFFILIRFQISSVKESLAEDRWSYKPS